jgi:hypothetical protein
MNSSKSHRFKVFMECRQNMLIPAIQAFGFMNIMETQPQYEDHQGLIIQVLGWEAAQKGDGAEPFIHSVRTYCKEKGAFSTWLFHNLILFGFMRFSLIKRKRRKK